MKIDQDGLAPDGVNGLARLDGLNDGSEVTLTSVTPGTTNSFRLLYWPPEDDEAALSLASGGGAGTPVWTFSPKAGVWGPYLIELIVDEGLASESRQQRVFGIPSPRLGLVYGALNERGDPDANLLLSGPELSAALALTDRNVDENGVLSIAGWQQSLRQIAHVVENMAPAYFSAWATGTYPIWAATSWSAIHNVVTMIDGVSAGITRSNSDFTFEDAGKYRIELTAYFHNNLANQVLAFRLRDVAGAATKQMGVGHSQVANILAQVHLSWVIDISAGQTLQMQYVRGSGTHGTAAAGSIDSETVRTFHLNMSRVG